MQCPIGNAANADICSKPIYPRKNAPRVRKNANSSITLAIRRIVPPEALTNESDRALSGNADTADLIMKGGYHVNTTTLPRLYQF